jgi:LPS sulfotransferase NodH
MKKFFILGCPRSGTTMLQQALNRHSRVVVPPETRYFSSFLGHSYRHQLRHAKRLDRDLQIRLPPPSRRIHGDKEARNFFEQMASLYLQRLNRTDVSYFGEKSPAHTGKLWRIKEVFPEAKILFLYRDGRDVALSLTKVPWMHQDLYVNFAVWLYYYWVLRQARECPGLDLLCIKYEELATNPDAELRKVLDFLLLDYEPAVAMGHGNSEGIPLHEYSWKARALEPITPDRIGLWRRELCEHEIAALERLGRSALESLGYSLLTGAEANLSAAFYARLSWNLFGLAWRLPWGAKTNEVLERLTRSPFSVSTITRTVLSAATMWSPGTEVQNGKGETVGVL